MRRVVPVLLLLTGLAGVGLSVDAQTQTDTIITVWEPGGFTPGSIEAIIEVVDADGGAWSVHHAGTLQMSAVTRDGVDVQRAPEGFRYPMSSLALDPDLSRSRIGAEAARVLDSGGIVMGSTSARIRGALAGDEITFLGWDKLEHTATLGLILDDRAVDSAELVFSLDAAAAFGFSRPSSMELWNVSDPSQTRDVLLAALSDRRIGVSLSTEPPDPDFVMSTARLKERFGEFAYRPTGDGDQIEIEPGWVEEHIVTVDLPVLGLFKCHRMVVPYLEAAMDDIVRGGLTGQIDPVDFQRAGGCFNPRMIRGGDKGGSISRHAWGVAIDLNPSTNPYGGAITLDRQVAEVFHYWGFAWGGGWVFTDGGHFEWKHLPAHVVRV